MAPNYSNLNIYFLAAFDRQIFLVAYYVCSKLSFDAMATCKQGCSGESRVSDQRSLRLTFLAALPQVFTAAIFLYSGLCFNIAFSKRNRG